jgi:hypothetical protein
MSEQQQGGPTLVNDELPWWIRIMRWLWKLAGFLGSAVLLELAVNVASTWLTASKGAFLSDAPPSILMTYWPTPTDLIVDIYSKFPLR